MVFPDPAMTIAAIHRLVHHATVIKMNVQSYRQRSATLRKSRTAALSSKAEPRSEPAPDRPT